MFGIGVGAWLLVRPIYTIFMRWIGPVIGWLAPSFRRARKASRSLISDGIGNVIVIGAVVALGLLAWRFMTPEPGREKYVAVSEVEYHLTKTELTAVKRAHESLVTAYRVREERESELQDKLAMLKANQRRDRENAQDGGAAIFSSDDDWLRGKRERSGTAQP